MKWDQRSASHQIYKTTGICSTSFSFPCDNTEAASTQLWRSPSPHVQCLPVSIRWGPYNSLQGHHDPPPAPCHFLSVFTAHYPPSAHCTTATLLAALGLLLELLPLLEYSPPGIHLSCSLTSSQSVFTFHLSMKWTLTILFNTQLLLKTLPYLFSHSIYLVLIY